MSFWIIGSGTFSKEAFVQKLTEWGFEPSGFVREVEQKGRVVCGGYKVLRVA